MWNPFVNNYLLNTFFLKISTFFIGLEKKRAQKLFVHKRVSHFRLEFKEPLPICIDGEIKGAKNIDFTVVPKAFNFVIPKGSDFKFKENKWKYFTEDRLA